MSESTTDFNLDLCKVQVRCPSGTCEGVSVLILRGQVSRLFSKVRVGERVEAAKAENTAMLVEDRRELRTLPWYCHCSCHRVSPNSCRYS